MEHEGTCTFVLARTSNEAAANIQEACTCGDEPLYAHVARRAREWSDDGEGTTGLVVGATAPEALSELRELCPSLPFLVPGVGAQGGSPRDVMAAAETTDGPVLVNSSRSILYASEEPDFAEAAAEAAKHLRDRLRAGRG